MKDVIKFQAAIFSILILLISSCQTSHQREIRSISMEERNSILMIKEWEEYMNAIDHNNFSVDTLLKLTENYFEGKEMLFNQEMELYDKNLDSYRKGSLKMEPLLPMHNYTSLIRNFRPVIKKYRHGRGADAIRYALGYALYAQGEIDEAMTVFVDIAKNYQWSNYLHEVSFRLGELYYAMELWDEALEAYEALLDFPDSVFYEKALYKIAWIYYKLNVFDKGVDLFMKIADRKGANDFKEEGIMQESIHGLVLSLSHFKSMDQAIDYLKSKGLRKYSMIVLEKLGNKLIDETRFEEAIIILTFITKLFPEKNPSLPFIYIRLADLYDRAGNKEKALHIRWDLANRFNSTTEWRRINYPSGSKKIDKLVSEIMVSVAKQSHAKSKNTKDPKDFKETIAAYRTFLSLFPKEPNSKEINLLLAEALFGAKIYDEAAHEYEKTALFYPVGKNRADISYSAFLSYEILFYQSTDKKNEIVNSAAHILSAFKSDFSMVHKLEKALHRLADMYIEVGGFAIARETLMPMAKEKKDMVAYKKIAEIYLLEDNLIAAEDAYSKIPKNYKDTAVKEKVAQLRYKIAGKNLQAEKYEYAVAMYNKTFSEYPGYHLGESALIQLGNIHIQKKNLNGLKDVVKSLVEAYPNSDGAVSLLIKAGQELEKEEPLKAAMLYEDASSIAHNREDAQKLLIAAGILFEKNKLYGKAENIFKKYLLEAIIPNESRAEALYRLGNIQMKRDKKEEGIETLNKMKELKEYLDNRKLAEANLLLLNERLENFFKIKLAYPFEETLKQKTLALDILLKEYSNIAKQRIAAFLPEIFFQMGRAIEDYRDSIIHSERPEELSKEELEEYNFLLEEKAYPYDDQAVKTYNRSIEAAIKNMIFNEWMDKSLKRLVDLRPALYKREIKEKDLEPVFIKPEPVSIGDFQ